MLFIKINKYLYKIYTMIKKDFLRIINEEISGFDFLSNEKQLKEDGEMEMLHSEQYQKQFIIDSITNMRNKVKIDTSDSYVSNDPDMHSDGYNNDMSLESNVEVSYQPDPTKQPIKFYVSFSGDRIGYSVGSEYDRGDYYTAPYGESWYDGIDWHSIVVELFTDDGDEIKFVALEKAPEKIYELFVRTYIENVIESKTEVGDVREKMPQYSPF